MGTQFDDGEHPLNVDPMTGYNRYKHLQDVGCEYYRCLKSLGCPGSCDGSIEAWVHASAPPQAVDCPLNNQPNWGSLEAAKVGCPDYIWHFVVWNEVRGCVDWYYKNRGIGGGC